MEMSATFDSLGYAKRLESVGVPRAQAEAQADALRDLIEGQLATKRDLRELEERLTYRLTLRLGGIVVACSTIMLTILALLIK